MGTHSEQIQWGTQPTEERVCGQNKYNEHDLAEECVTYECAVNRAKYGNKFKNSYLITGIKVKRIVATPFTSLSLMMS